MPKLTAEEIEKINSDLGTLVASSLWVIREIADAREKEQYIEHLKNILALTDFSVNDEDLTDLDKLVARVNESDIKLDASTLDKDLSEPDIQAFYAAKEAVDNRYDILVAALLKTESVDSISATQPSNFTEKEKKLSEKIDNIKSLRDLDNLRGEVTTASNEAISEKHNNKADQLITDTFNQTNVKKFNTTSDVINIINAYIKLSNEIKFYEYSVSTTANANAALHKTTCTDNLAALFKLANTNLSALLSDQARTFKEKISAYIYFEKMPDSPDKKKLETLFIRAVNEKIDSLNISDPLALLRDDDNTISNINIAITILKNDDISTKLLVKMNLVKHISEPEAIQALEKIMTKMGDTSTVRLEKISKFIGNYKHLYKKVPKKIIARYDAYRQKLIENVSTELTAYSIGLLSTINPEEVNQPTAKLLAAALNNKPATMPTFFAYAEGSTAITNNVIYSIQENRNPEAIVLMAKSWLEIADRCISTGDINTCLSIYSALSSAGIAGFISSFDNTPEYKKLYDNLNTIFSPSSSYKNIRSADLRLAVDNNNIVHIPHAGYSMSDLLFVVEGNTINDTDTDDAKNKKNAIVSKKVSEVMDRFKKSKKNIATTTPKELTTIFPRNTRTEESRLSETIVGDKVRPSDEDKTNAGNVLKTPGSKSTTLDDLTKSIKSQVSDKTAYLNKKNFESIHSILSNDENYTTWLTGVPSDAPAVKKIKAEFSTCFNKIKKNKGFSQFKTDYVKEFKEFNVAKMVAFLNLPENTELRDLLGNNNFSTGYTNFQDFLYDKKALETVGHSVPRATHPLASSTPAQSAALSSDASASANPLARSAPLAKQGEASLNGEIFFADPHVSDLPITSAQLLWSYYQTLETMHNDNFVANNVSLSNMLISAEKGKRGEKRLPNYLVITWVATHSTNPTLRTTIGSDGSIENLSGPSSLWDDQTKLKKEKFTVLSDTFAFRVAILEKIAKDLGKNFATDIFSSDCETICKDQGNVAVLESYIKKIEVLLNDTSIDEKKRHDAKEFLTAYKSYILLQPPTSAATLTSPAAIAVETKKDRELLLESSKKYYLSILKSKFLEYPLADENSLRPLVTSIQRIMIDLPEEIKLSPEFYFYNNIVKNARGYYIDMSKVMPKNIKNDLTKKLGVFASTFTTKSDTAAPVGTFDIYSRSDWMYYWKQFENEMESRSILNGSDRINAHKMVIDHLHFAKPDHKQYFTNIMINLDQALTAPYTNTKSYLSAAKKEFTSQFSATWQPNSKYLFEMERELNSASWIQVFSNAAFITIIGNSIRPVMGKLSSANKFLASLEKMHSIAAEINALVQRDNNAFTRAEKVIATLDKYAANISQYMLSRKQFIAEATAKAPDILQDTTQALISNGVFYSDDELSSVLMEPLQKSLKYTLLIKEIIKNALDDRLRDQASRLKTLSETFGEKFNKYTKILENVDNLEKLLGGKGGSRSAVPTAELNDMISNIQVSIHDYYYNDGKDANTKKAIGDVINKHLQKLLIKMSKRSLSDNEMKDVASITHNLEILIPCMKDLDEAYLPPTASLYITSIIKQTAEHALLETDNKKLDGIVSNLEKFLALEKQLAQGIKEEILTQNYDHEMQQLNHKELQNNDPVLKAKIVAVTDPLLPPPMPLGPPPMPTPHIAATHETLFHVDSTSLSEKDQLALIHLILQTLETIAPLMQKAVEQLAVILVTHPDIFKPTSSPTTTAPRTSYTGTGDI